MNQSENATALSRRNMLLGLAVSATAATATGATAGPKENPALIALADDLPAVTAAYVAARDEVKRIVAEWSPQWPVPAEEIVTFRNGSKSHRGIDGSGIQTRWPNSDVMRMTELGTPELFTESALRHEAEVKRKSMTKSQRGMKFELLWAERDRAAIEPARAYWSEVERIKQASGIEAAQSHRTERLDALRDHVDAIMSADDRTITGVVIKAQALGAWAEADHFARNLNLRGPVWADQLAASILRHASAG